MNRENAPTMDIIELLENDHDEVDELFRRFHLADRGETIDELSRQIVHELSVHAAVEEQFVYPLVRAKVSAEEAEHGIEEHAEVKRLLADIEKAEPGSAEHRRLLEEVVEAVRHHVEDEEGDMFPKLREATDAELRENLGSLVEKAKHVVPTHPHPLVPGNATAQLVAGPWATVVDKARDFLGGGPRET